MKSAQSNLLSQGQSKDREERKRGYNRNQGTLNINAKGKLAIYYEHLAEPYC